MYMYTYAHTCVYIYIYSTHAANLTAPVFEFTIGRIWGIRRQAIAPAAVTQDGASMKFDHDCERTKT